MTEVVNIGKGNKALFIDAYSSSHVGNDVLFDSSLELLRRICPDVEVEVHAQVPESFQETIGIPCKSSMFSDIPQGKTQLEKITWLGGFSVFLFFQIVNSLTIKLPPHYLTFSPLRRAALKSIEDTDFVISIGGEMINDSFRKTLPMYMFMFWLSARLGKKVIIFPQSIGPLRRGWTRWLTALVLGKCTVVTARDEPSIKELYSLGLSGDQAMSSPDVGVEQPAVARAEAENALADIGLTLHENTVWIGVIASSWVEEGVSSKNYLDTLADSLIQLSKTHNIGVLFMPANMPVYGNDAADYQAAEYVKGIIKGHMPINILDQRVYSARLYKGIAGCMDVIVSTRMHAAILSSMIGTPTITINTQRKLYGFMQNIGQEQRSINIEDLSSERLTTCIAECVENSQTIKDSLTLGYQKVSASLSVYAGDLKNRLCL